MMQKGTNLLLKQYRRTFVTLCVIAACGISIFIGCKQTGDSAEQDNGIAPCEITDDFDSLFSGMFADDEPGAVIAVMRDGKIVYNRSFGLALLDHAENITDSTVFNIASESQSFSAAAIMKLAQEHVISLDDSLSKFFPEFPDRIFSKIKISDVLNHCSGLPDLRPRNASEWEKYMQNNSSVFCEAGDFRLYGYENEQMKAFSQLEGVDYEPSVYYQPADPGQILIAPLLERATGCEYDKWMTENIFKPAGLQETFYISGNLKRTANASHGYRPLTDAAIRGSYRSDDNKWEEHDYGEAEFFVTRADKGAFSSARDVLRFREKLFNGEIIADSMLALFRKPASDVSTSHNDRIALGMGLREKPEHATSVFHCNRNGGYRCISSSFPDRALHYVIIANRSDWEGYETMGKVDSILHAKDWI